MTKYIYKPYSAQFPKLFAAEKARLSAHLIPKAIIEHVGSTAVPGLGGKGIIDIAIAVQRSDFELVKEQLQTLGYEFRKTYSTPDRLYFVIFLPDPEEKTRRYHIHLMDPDSSGWKNFLAFRDYLRNNPDAAQEYAEVKKSAAREANQDGIKYRALKEHIFHKSPTANLCRCCSGRSYAECCKPFHDGALPQTALQLMRSRFSAYALGLSEYIIQTTHPDNPAWSQDRQSWENEIDAFSKNTEFKHLEILDTKENEVTFRAHLAQNNRDCSFTEVSLFERLQGRWLYKMGHIM